MSKYRQEKEHVKIETQRRFNSSNNDEFQVYQDTEQIKDGRMLYVSIKKAVIYVRKMGA